MSALGSHRQTSQREEHQRYRRHGNHRCDQAAGHCPGPAGSKYRGGIKDVQRGKSADVAGAVQGHGKRVGNKAQASTQENTPGNDRRPWELQLWQENMPYEYRDECARGQGDGRCCNGHGEPHRFLAPEIDIFAMQANQPGQGRGQHTCLDERLHGIGEGPEEHVQTQRRFGNQRGKNEAIAESDRNQREVRWPDRERGGQHPARPVAADVGVGAGKHSVAAAPVQHRHKVDQRARGPSGHDRFERAVAGVEQAQQGDHGHPQGAAHGDRQIGCEIRMKGGECQVQVQPDRFPPRHDQREDEQRVDVMAEPHPGGHEHQRAQRHRDHASHQPVAQHAQAVGHVVRHHVADQVEVQAETEQRGREQDGPGNEAEQAQRDQPDAPGNIDRQREPQDERGNSQGEYREGRVDRFAHQTVARYRFVVTSGANREPPMPCAIGVFQRAPSTDFIMKPKTPFTPDFFIIGFPKCGTTSLASALGQIDRVVVASEKEPHFFSPENSYSGVFYDEAGYRSLFGSDVDGCLTFEASTWYAYNPNALRDILRRNPEAVFVLCLRDPREMIRSLHSHNQRDGVDDYIEAADAWEMEGSRKAPIPEQARRLEYRDLSSLGSHYARVLEQVGPEKLHVLFLEDLVAQPQMELSRLADFLGRDEIASASLAKENAARAYRSPLLRKLHQLKKGIVASAIIRIAKAVMPASVRYRLLYQESAKPQEAAMDRFVDMTSQHREDQLALIEATASRHGQDRVARTARRLLQREA